MPERSLPTMEPSKNAEKPASAMQAIDEDRLSQLPTSILHMILSCLYTNDVMKTCTFGKRWRNVWATMPYLRLADGIFLNGDNDEKFKQFVDKLLASRDLCDVHSFQLCWFKNFDPSIFDSWVRFLVEHNIRLLEIDAGECDELVVLPDSFFTCKSLEELSFTCAELSSLYAPAYTSLPQLRRLCLGNCLLSSSIELFITSCPLLEELNVQNCGISEANISSDKMKKLIIRDCRIFGTTMKISCTKLKQLHYINNVTVKDRSRKGHVLMLEKLWSLHDASIVNDAERMDIFNGIDSISELCNADNIKLLTQGMESIREDQLKMLPTFDNLKHLTIGRLHKRTNFEKVAHFLRNAPCLETLTLVGQEAAQLSYSVQINVRSSKTLRRSTLCPNLKFVEIQLEGIKEIRTVRKILDQMLTHPSILSIQAKSHGFKNCM